MTECPHCGLRFSDPSLSQAGNCPNCGHSLGEGASAPPSSSGESQRGPIAQYFWKLKTVIFRPREFFDSEPFEGGLAEPLAFALVTHWIATAVSYLWKGWYDTGSMGLFKRLAQMSGNSDQIEVLTRNSSHWLEAQHAMTNWIFGVGSVIADPFYTLFSILIASFFVFIGARLLVSHPSRPITYESAARIVSYSMAVSIFGAFPLLGGLIAVIYRIYVEMVGAERAYDVSAGRALLIVLFPSILFIGIFLALTIGVFLVFGFAIVKMLMGGGF